jgi:tRNA A-37 threonylcarbamoyl transferase component Bud32
MDPANDDDSGVFEVPHDAPSLTAEQRARVVGGRYEILERIGQGGMGQVMRVRHTRLAKTYALKLMHPELAVDPEARRLFEREAKLASHLSHPNIVEMIDFGSDPDWGLFIVMEYLEGEALSKRVEHLGHLSIAAACRIAAQLADALAHSHGEHVIHGDLKTENVFCLKDGEVKLLDFGTARLATASGSSEHIAGTPEYIAPERIRGGPPQPSGDIYALGIILYEMLCGTPPFSGGEPAQLLQRHLDETPEPAGARRGEVLDARLDAIVTKALAKDPKDRYATASALLDDLKPYMDVLGVRQKAGTLPPLNQRVDARADAAAAAFDACGLPAAGLLRDGTIIIANHAFAHFVGFDAIAQVEGQNIYRTLIHQMNPELHDDLRVVALNGEMVRRDLEIASGDRPVGVRFILAPASGACGHCMLLLHST